MVAERVTCVTAFSHPTQYSHYCFTPASCTTAIMAPAKSNQRKAAKATAKKVVQAKVDGEARASWSTEDEAELIQFLIEHVSEVGNGFNFKTVTFNAASLVLDPKKTKGAAKTGKVCKNKWMQVCCALL